MAIHVNTKGTESVALQQDYLVSDFVMATAIKQKFGITETDTVSPDKFSLPERDPIEVDEESSYHEGLVRDAKAYRSELRKSCGIGCEEQKYRDRANLIQPDSIQIGIMVNSLYNDGVLKDSMTVEETASAVLKHIQDNFNYIKEPLNAETGPSDHWQSVRETLDKKGGDCEDLAILQASVLSQALKHKGYSSKEVGEMVTVAVGYVTYKQMKYGHATVKLTLKEGNTTQSYTLDATKDKGIRSFDEANMDMLFEVNNRRFEKYADIENNFITTFRQPANEDGAIDVLTTYTTEAGSSIFGASTDHEQGFMEGSQAYNENNNALVWRINDHVKQLSAHLQETIKIPRIYKGTLYSQVDVDFNVEAEDQRPKKRPPTSDEPDVMARRRANYYIKNSDGQYVVNSHKSPPTSDEHDGGSGPNPGTQAPRTNADNTKYQNLQLEIEDRENDIASLTVALEPFTIQMNKYKEEIDKHQQKIGVIRQTNGLGPEESNSEIDHLNELISNLLNNMKSIQDNPDYKSKKERIEVLQNEIIELLGELTSLGSDGEIEAAGKAVEWVRTVSEDEIKARGLNLMPGQLVSVSSEADRQTVLQKMKDETEAIDNLKNNIKNLEREISLLPPGTRDPRKEVLLKLKKSQLLKLEKNKTKLYKRIDETDESYQFFSIHSERLTSSDPKDKVKLDIHVQSVRIKSEKFFTYLNDVRKHMNALVMLYHMANGLMETRLFESREVHDQSLTSDSQKFWDKTREKTDKDFGKLTATLNKFQSKIMSGMEQVSDELFGFVNTTNQALFTKRQLEIESWAREQDDTSVQRFILAFLKGSSSEFVDEMTKTFSYIRKKAGEELARIQADVAADNAKAMAKYLTYITFGEQDEKGVSTSGIKLWESDIENSAGETIDENLIHNEKYKDNPLYFGKPVYDLLSPKDLNKVNAREFSKQFLQKFISKFSRFDINFTTEDDRSNALDESELIIDTLQRSFEGYSPGVLGDLYNIARQQENNTTPYLNNRYNRPAIDLSTNDGRDEDIHNWASFHASSADRGTHAKIVSRPVADFKDNAEMNSAKKFFEGLGKYIGPAINAATKALTIPIKAAFDGISKQEEGSGPVPLFLDFHMEKQMEFRKRMIRFQIATFMALVIKQSIWDKKRDMAKQISGQKTTSSSGGVVTSTKQALEGELNKQTKAFESMHQNLIQLHQSSNRLIKSRVDFNKVIWEMPLKLSSMTAKFSVMLKAQSLAKSQSTFIRSNAKISMLNQATGVLQNPTQPLSLVEEMMMMGDPDYWNYAYRAKGDSIVSNIEEQFKMGIESLVWEFQKPKIVQDESFSEFSERGTQSKQKEFKKATQEANLVENILGDTRNVSDDGNLLKYYKNKLGGLMLKSREEYTYLGTKKYDTGLQKIDLEGIPGQKGGDEDGSFDRGLSFFENSGDGKFTYNGYLGAHKIKNATHYKNLIKRHMLVLKVIHEALETEAAQIANMQKPGGFSKLGGESGFSVINAILDGESKNVNDLRQEIKGQLLPALNANFERDRILHQQEEDVTKTVVKTPGDFILPFIPLQQGPVSHGLFTGAVDDGFSIKKNAWGPFAGLLASYWRNNPTKDRQEAIRDLEKRQINNANKEEYSGILYSGMLQDENSESGHHESFENDDTQYYGANPARFHNTDELGSPQDIHNRYRGMSTYNRENESIFTKFQMENADQDNLEYFQNKAARLEPLFRSDELEKNVFYNVLYGGKMIEYKDARYQTSEHTIEPIRRQADHFGFKQVNFTDIMRLQRRMGNMHAVRMIMMMLEQALYQQRMAAMKELTGTAYSGGIIEATMTLMDNYNTGQSEIFNELVSEISSQVESENNYRNAEVEMVNEAVAGSLVTLYTFRAYFADNKKRKQNLAKLQQVLVNPAAAAGGDGSGVSYNKMVRNTQRAMGFKRAFEYMGQLLIGTLSYTSAKAPDSTTIKKMAVYDKENENIELSEQELKELNELKKKKYNRLSNAEKSRRSELLDREKNHKRKTRHDELKSKQGGNERYATLTDNEATELAELNIEFDSVDKPTESEDDHSSVFGMEGDDIVKFSNRGRLTADKSVLTRAQRKLKSRFRKIQLLREIALAVTQAKLSELSDITGIEPSSSYTGIMSIINKYQTTQSNIIESFFKSYEEVAKAKERALAYVRDAIKKVLENTAKKLIGYIYGHTSKRSSELKKQMDRNRDQSTVGRRSTYFANRSIATMAKIAEFSTPLITSFTYDVALAAMLEEDGDSAEIDASFIENEVDEEGEDSEATTNVSDLGFYFSDSSSNLLDTDELENMLLYLNLMQDKLSIEELVIRDNIERIKEGKNVLDKLHEKTKDAFQKFLKLDKDSVQQSRDAAAQEAEKQATKFLKENKEFIHPIQRRLLEDDSIDFFTKHQIEQNLQINPEIFHDRKLLAQLTTQANQRIRENWRQENGSHIRYMPTALHKQLRGQKTARQSAYNAGIDNTRFSLLDRIKNPISRAVISPFYGNTQGAKSKLEFLAGNLTPEQWEDVKSDIKEGRKIRKVSNNKTSDFITTVFDSIGTLFNAVVTPALRILFIPLGILTTLISFFGLAGDFDTEWGALQDSGKDVLNTLNHIRKLENPFRDTDLRVNTRERAIIRLLEMEYGIDTDTVTQNQMYLSQKEARRKRLLKQRRRIGRTAETVEKALHQELNPDQENNVEAFRNGQQFSNPYDQLTQRAKYDEFERTIAPFMQHLRQEQDRLKHAQNREREAGDQEFQDRKTELENRIRDEKNIFKKRELKRVLADINKRVKYGDIDQHTTSFFLGRFLRTHKTKHSVNGILQSDLKESSIKLQQISNGLKQQMQNLRGIAAPGQPAIGPNGLPIAPQAVGANGLPIAPQAVGANGLPIPPQAVGPNGLPIPPVAQPTTDTIDVDVLKGHLDALDHVLTSQQQLSKADAFRTGLEASQLLTQYKANPKQGHYLERFNSVIQGVEYNNIHQSHLVLNPILEKLETEVTRLEALPVPLAAADATRLAAVKAQINKIKDIKEKEITMFKEKQTAIEGTFTHADLSPTRFRQSGFFKTTNRPTIFSRFKLFNWSRPRIGTHKLPFPVPSFNPLRIFNLFETKGLFVDHSSSSDIKYETKLRAAGFSSGLDYGRSFQRHLRNARHDMNNRVDGVLGRQGSIGLSALNKTKGKFAQLEKSPFQDDLHKDSKKEKRYRNTHVLTPPQQEKENRAKVAALGEVMSRVEIARSEARVATRLSHILKQQKDGDIAFTHVANEILDMITEGQEGYELATLTRQARTGEKTTPTDREEILPQAKALGVEMASQVLALMRFEMPKQYQKLVRRIESHTLVNEEEIVRIAILKAAASEGTITRLDPEKKHSGTKIAQVKHRLTPSFIQDFDIFKDINEAALIGKTINDIEGHTEGTTQYFSGRRDELLDHRHLVPLIGNIDPIHHSAGSNPDPSYVENTRQLINITGLKQRLTDLTLTDKANIIRKIRQDQDLDPIHRQNALAILASLGFPQTAERTRLSRLLAQDPAPVSLEASTKKHLFNKEKRSHAQQLRTIQENPDAPHAADALDQLRQRFETTKPFGKHEETMLSRELALAINAALHNPSAVALDLTVAALEAFEQAPGIREEIAALEIGEYLEQTAIQQLAAYHQSRHLEPNDSLFGRLAAFNDNQQPLTNQRNSSHAGLVEQLQRFDNYLTNLGGNENANYQTSGLLLYDKELKEKFANLLAHGVASQHDQSVQLALGLLNKLITLHSNQYDNLDQHKELFDSFIKKVFKITREQGLLATDTMRDVVVKMQNLTQQDPEQRLTQRIKKGFLDAASQEAYQALRQDNKPLTQYQFNLALELQGLGNGSMLNDLLWNKIISSPEAAAEFSFSGQAIVRVLGVNPSALTLPINRMKQFLETVPHQIKKYRDRKDKKDITALKRIKQFLTALEHNLDPINPNHPEKLVFQQRLVRLKHLVEKEIDLVQAQKYEYHPNVDLNPYKDQPEGLLTLPPHEQVVRDQVLLEIRKNNPDIYKKLWPHLVALPFAQRHTLNLPPLVLQDLNLITAPEARTFYHELIDTQTPAATIQRKIAELIQIRADRTSYLDLALRLNPQTVKTAIQKVYADRPPLITPAIIHRAGDPDDVRETIHRTMVNIGLINKDNNEATPLFIHQHLRSKALLLQALQKIDGFQDYSPVDMDYIFAHITAQVPILDVVRELVTQDFEDFSVSRREASAELNLQRHMQDILTDNIPQQGQNFFDIATQAQRAHDSMLRTFS